MNKFEKTTNTRNKGILKFRKKGIENLDEELLTNWCKKIKAFSIEFMKAVILRKKPRL